MIKKHKRADVPAPVPFVLAPQKADGEPYTTSEIIAEGAGIQRRTVDRLILTHKTDFEEFGILRFEIAKLEGRGRPETIYHLTEQQATLLMTYLKNTETVRAFKKELVRQFYAMRSMLQERASPVWHDTRSLGKEIRRQETDAIKRLVEYAKAQGSQHAARYYVNLSRLADKTAGIVERDKAQVVQLTALLLVERIIAEEITAGIEAGVHYKLIYQGVRDRLEAFSSVGALTGKEV